MKKILTILLLLSSCQSQKQEEVLIHDINSDFPTADTVIMKYKQSFESPSTSIDFIVKDNTLFALGENSKNVGYCYNIDNGALITTIINGGKAANEVITGNHSLIITSHKDSIQLIDLILREIKSIALNDILTKPMGERELSKMSIPEAVGSLNYKKIDNNRVIGHNYKNDKKAKYFISDGKELTLFGEYNRKMVETTGDIIAGLYMPLFANYGSKVISADRHGVTLELIDVNTKSIVKDRFYTKFIMKETGIGAASMKPVDHSTDRVYCTDNEIYCVVREIDKVKPPVKGDRFSDLYLLVFDWDLNPIKKYYIGSFLIISKTKSVFSFG